jgi:hypothetical protein
MLHPATRPPATFRRWDLIPLAEVLVDLGRTATAWSALAGIGIPALIRMHGYPVTALSSARSVMVFMALV